MFNLDHAFSSRTHHCEAKHIPKCAKWSLFSNPVTSTLVWRFLCCVFCQLVLFILSKVTHVSHSQIDCDQTDISPGPKAVMPGCATTSNGKGEFVFPSLPPGNYSLVCLIELLHCVCVCDAYSEMSKPRVHWIRDWKQ